MYRSTPLTGRLFERWRHYRGLPVGLEAAAERSWVISPTVDRRVPGAIFLPGDLERIAGIAPDSHTLESQIARVRGGIERHMATRAFMLKNVVLSDGHLYTHRMVRRFGSRKVPLFAARCDRRIDRATLATSPYGVKYFGHWMSDDLPLGLAARDFDRPVSILDDPTPQQTQYLSLLGLESEVLSSARFAELLILEDFAQNDYKRERYAKLRELARPKQAPEAHHGVMLLRGSSGERRVLTNEPDVAGLARRRGFRVIDPARLAAAEIIRCCLDAKVVIGVEGSQLVNGLMWMDPRGSLVVIQPPNRFNLTHKDRCDAEEIAFAFVVGEAEGDGDFRVDLGRLERLLDLVDSARGAR